MTYYRKRGENLGIKMSRKHAARVAREKLKTYGVKVMENTAKTQNQETSQGKPGSHFIHRLDIYDFLSDPNVLKKHWKGFRFLKVKDQSIVPLTERRCEYQGEWDDDTVAEVLGVDRYDVKEVRYKGFGRIKECAPAKPKKKDETQPAIIPTADSVFSAMSAMSPEELMKFHQKMKKFKK